MQSLLQANTPEGQSRELDRLLKSWDLTCLRKVFDDEGITMRELAMMQYHHIGELLQNHQLSLRIRFEHFFTKWRTNTGCPLQENRCLNCGSSQMRVYNNVKIKPYVSPLLLTPERDIYKEHLRNMEMDDEKCEEKAPQQNAPVEKPMKSLFSFGSLLSSKKDRPKLILRPAPTFSGPEFDFPRPSDFKELADIIAMRTTPVPPTPEVVTLRDILADTGSRGEAIIDYYKSNQELTQFHRSSLIHLIVAFFDLHDFHLSLHISHRLERDILAMFPGEKLENYRTEKRGKIYVKYCNMKRYRREKPGTKRKSTVNVPSESGQEASDVDDVVNVNGTGDAEDASIIHRDKRIPYGDPKHFADLSPSQFVKGPINSVQDFIDIMDKKDQIIDRHRTARLNQRTKKVDCTSENLKKALNSAKSRPLISKADQKANKVKNVYPVETAENDTESDHSSYEDFDDLLVKIKTETPDND